MEAGEAPFPHADDLEPTEEMLANRGTFDRAVGVSCAGLGLMAAGGVFLGVSSPIGVLKHKQEYQVTMPAGVLTADDPFAPHTPWPSVEGATFRVTIR